MRPIRQGDGTGLSASGVSEVRTGDGTVLWSAGGDIPDSGVSRLTFDNEDTSAGTAVDVWGNNDGTINGATTGAPGANQTYSTKEAYSFDGVDDNVELGDVLDLQPFSVTAWIRPTTVSEFDPIVAKYGGGVPDSYRLANDAGVLLFQTSDNAASGGSISTDTWYFVAGVNDGSESRIYLDGSVVDTVSSNGNSISTDTLYVGRDEGGNHFGGRIDDVRFYNKGLTDNEVSNLYQTGNIK